MKLFFLFYLLTSSAWALVIPVEGFDQSKLEHLMRKMPSAFVKTVTMEGFERRHYVFPSNDAPFSFKCSADYYLAAKVPSMNRCEVTVNEGKSEGIKVEAKNDEIVVKLTDKKFSSALYNGISHGQALKKLYSTERAFGVSATGTSRYLFRYLIWCQPESCELSFTNLSPQNYKSSRGYKSL